ncbi:uncharacterized protein CPUR_01492 [Claviceps purpurea 20.1]|uniref:Uncharacterized protein n=1 Tax=Claviceps purpurea (strain 20.1) TaxID=1111077 RepID=M1W6T3_CLAP2|nr:hypothetical protein E4U12_006784 [Claviceps purpurea]CCE28018.1 uncharacterized protein CPUR_01492 [Claviceps purpurea 20.1]
MAPASPLPFVKSRPVTAVSPEHPPVTEHRIKVFPSLPGTPGHDDDDGYSKEREETDIHESRIFERTPNSSLESEISRFFVASGDGTDSWQLVGCSAIA